MATAFQSDAFQNNAFQIDADTRDGGRNIRRVFYEEEEVREEVNARALEYRRNRERLRADIILAMDGPREQEALAVIEEHLGDEREALSAPDYEPELRGLLAEMSALKRIAALALAEEKRRFDEDEEDVEFLLLQ